MYVLWHHSKIMEDGLLNLVVDMMEGKDRWNTVFVLFWWEKVGKKCGKCRDVINVKDVKSIDVSTGFVSSDMMEAEKSNGNNWDYGRRMRLSVHNDCAEHNIKVKVI